MALTPADVRGGIYALLNTVNGKRYIGQALYPVGRKSRHFFSLRNNRHENEHLQRAYNKYGEPAFSFHVLEFCRRSDLTAREQFWIDSFGKENLYNIAPAANSRAGIRMSEATKAKLRAANLGKKLSPERRENLRLLRIGRPRRPMPQRTRDALRAANQGRQCTDEAKAKISQANRGRKRSAEHIAKLVSCHQGKPHTDEYKRRLSDIKKAYYAANPHPGISAATRAKMSAVHKARWSAKRSDA